MDDYSTQSEEGSSSMMIIIIIVVVLIIIGGLSAYFLMGTKNTTETPTVKKPPTEDVVPPTEAVVPPTEDVVPPTEAVVPPTEDVVPPTEAVVPPTEDVVPPTTEVDASIAGTTETDANTNTETSAEVKSSGNIETTEPDLNPEITKIRIERTLINFSGVSLIDLNNNFITGWYKSETANTHSLWSGYSGENNEENINRDSLTVFTNNETNLAPISHIGELGSGSFHSALLEGNWVEVEVNNDKLRNLKYMAFVARGDGSQERLIGMTIKILYKNKETGEDSEYVFNTNDIAVPENGVMFFEIDRLFEQPATLKTDLDALSITLKDDVTSAETTEGFANVSNMSRCAFNKYAPTNWTY